MGLDGGRGGDGQSVQQQGTGEFDGKVAGDIPEREIELALVTGQGRTSGRRAFSGDKAARLRCTRLAASPTRPRAPRRADRPFHQPMGAERARPLAQSCAVRVPERPSDLLLVEPPQRGLIDLQFAF